MVVKKNLLSLYLKVLIFQHYEAQGQVFFPTGGE